MLNGIDLLLLCDAMSDVCSDVEDSGMGIVKEGRYLESNQT